VAYLRVGTSKRPLSIQEILALGVEELLFQLDRLPTDAPARELSMKYVRWFGERRRSRGLERTDVKRLIRTLGAITRKNGRSVLSLGGLLFFHPRPQDYLPHAAIRVIRSDRWKRFEGPVWSAVDEALAHIVAGLSTASLVVGARREDYPEYPPRALREALVNAVVHRNYSISSEVFVRIENDKLSISNPGGFPPGTSVENPRPVPRNPLLYELMFQAGYVERQGRGIRLIQEECEKHPFVCVEFRTGPDFTEVIFHKKPAELDDLETRLLAVLRGRELPSSALARELGTSKVTVLRRLKRLEAMGLVRARGRGAQRRYFTVNRA
jgi:ATP-dependent DNA helicase RecG